MMKRLSLFNLLLASLLICGCSKDDVKPEPVIVPVVIIDPPNQSPFLFSVHVAEIGKDYVVITWDLAGDPDLDTVYHKVFLEDVLVSSVTKSDSTFTIRNLNPSHTYHGYIQATDKKSEPVNVTFSFTTKLKVTVFSKLFSNLGGVDLLLAKDGGFVTAYGLNKFDSLGNIIFSSHINPPSYGPIYTDLIQSADDGYLFANRFQIQKFDKNGDYLWTSEGYDEYTVYNAIAQLPDGGYLAVGSNVGLGGIIQKFNGAGKKVWLKHFDRDDPETMVNCTSITKTADGHYMVAGSSGASLDTLAISKIDVAGEILWVRNYSIGNYVFNVRVSPVSDGSYIIGAKTVKLNNAYVAWVLNLTEEGTVIWNKSFSLNTEDTQLNSIIELRDGDYMFVGSKGDYHKSALLVKLSHSGELIWQKEYYPNEPDYQWLFWAIRETQDGGLVMIGGKKFVYSGSEEGFWLLKTDDEGNFK
jgi:hypothetical protein